MCEHGPGTDQLGLNTLLLSVSATPVPDIVALAATPTNDGIVNIPGTNGTGAFAVATVNVGASGSITASADTGSATLPVNIFLCQTNPATGQCISGIGSSVTTQINANATPTFGIFVEGSGNVPFDPAANRVFVRFKRRRQCNARFHQRGGKDGVKNTETRAVGGTVMTLTDDRHLEHFIFSSLFQLGAIDCGSGSTIESLRSGRNFCHGVCDHC